MLVQLLTSCPDILCLSFNNNNNNNNYKKDSSSYRRPSYSSYDNLSGYSEFDSLPASVCDSSFKILASLQLSVRVLGSEFVCLNKSVNSPSTPALMCGDNNPPNLRKQGKLALTFALRRYGDVPAADRIRIANQLEEEIDREYVAGEYREMVYFFGGLLAEEGRGRETVEGLVDGTRSVESVLLLLRGKGNSGRDPGQTLIQL